MPGAINLRQIEVFKALIEHGTVSRAAEVLAISQPAASRLLMHLEDDTGLHLFDRRKGRLLPTAQGARLYEEVERIFAGVRQVESAVAVIRREHQGRLAVGVLPALAGEFIQAATTGFLQRHPGVYCSIQSVGSRSIAQDLLARKLDVALVSARVDDPSVATERLLDHRLVCIMKPGHELSLRAVVRPEDLHGVPFVSFSPVSYTAQVIAGLFERHGVEARTVLTADVTATLCGFVAAGLGVSLVHPVFVAGMEGRIVSRPFEPETRFDFLLCFAREARNAVLVADFVAETRALAARVSARLGREGL